MRDDELYEYLGQTFEWDRAKARKNWLEHRVYFTEAATVFFDEDVVYFKDEDHSIEEERYIVVDTHGVPGCCTWFTSYAVSAFESSAQGR